MGSHKIITPRDARKGEFSSCIKVVQLVLLYDSLRPFFDSLISLLLGDEIFCGELESASEFVSTVDDAVET